MGRSTNRSGEKKEPRQKEIKFKELWGGKGHAQVSNSGQRDLAE